MPCQGDSLVQTAGQMPSRAAVPKHRGQCRVLGCTRAPLGAVGCGHSSSRNLSSCCPGPSPAGSAGTQGSLCAFCRDRGQVKLSPALPGGAGALGLLRSPGSAKGKIDFCSKCDIVWVVYCFIYLFI